RHLPFTVFDKYSPMAQESGQRRRFQYKRAAMSMPSRQFRESNMRHLAFTTKAIAALFVLAATTPACAHVGVGPHTHALGFTVGFSHPWLGLDHLLAMVAVGLLAVRAHQHTPGNRALWLLPAGFVSGMIIGGL